MRRRAGRRRRAARQGGRARASSARASTPPLSDAARSSRAPRRTCDPRRRPARGADRQGRCLERDRLGRCAVDVDRDVLWFDALPAGRSREKRVVPAISRRRPRPSRPPRSSRRRRPASRQAIAHRTAGLIAAAQHQAHRLARPAARHACGLRGRRRAVELERSCARRSTPTPALSRSRSPARGFRLGSGRADAVRDAVFAAADPDAVAADPRQRRVASKAGACRRCATRRPRRGPGAPGRVSSKRSVTGAAYGPTFPAASSNATRSEYSLRPAEGGDGRRRRGRRRHQSGRRRRASAAGPASSHPRA